MNGLIRIGLILLHHVVPIWWLPIFVLAALILTVLYDEFGPHGE
jgi:hypothetical protein